MTIENPNTTLPLYHGDRSRIIGASDAAALLGCSGFTTRTGMILRKRGLAVEQGPNARTDGGHWIEPALRYMACQKLQAAQMFDGIPFSGPMIQGQQADFGFHPDGWLYFDTGNGTGYFALLEIKCTLFAGDEWRGELDQVMLVTPEYCPLPTAYIHQICFQLACLEGTGIDQAICVGFRAGSKLLCTYYVFHRVTWKDYIAKVVAELNTLTARYLAPQAYEDATDANGEILVNEHGEILQIPLYEDPPIDSSDECRQWLVGLWPAPWKPLRRGSEAEHLKALDYHDAREQAKQWTEAKERIGNELLMSFGEDQGFSGRYGAKRVKAARNKAGNLLVTVGD